MLDGCADIFEEHLAVELVDRRRLESVSQVERVGGVVDRVDEQDAVHFSLQTSSDL